MNNSHKKKYATSPYKGKCLCGEVQYSVDSIESQIGHCHCSMCRKFHGAAFATFGEANVECFHWLAGEQFLKTYQAPNGTRRTFCSECGSSLIFQPSNDLGLVVEFTLGTLDSDIPHKPDAHIFLDSKACWYDIEGDSDMPQFSVGRDSKKNNNTDNG
jgi:hypothetical protein